jgi:hypothetical protein
MRVVGKVCWLTLLKRACQRSGSRLYIILYSLMHSVEEDLGSSTKKALLIDWKLLKSKC